MRTRSAGMLAMVLLTMTATAAGCGGGPPVSKTASPGTSAESSAAAGAAFEASVTAKKQAVEITTPGGGTISLGGELGKIPDGFPTGLPLYTKGVKAGSVVDTAKGLGFTVQMTTGDTVDTTYTKYREKLSAAGYTIKSGGVVTVKGTQRAFITFQKGKATGVVNIVSEGPAAGDRTAITLQVVVPK
jgi:hypothetical protein